MTEYIISSFILLFLSIAMLALAYFAWKLSRKIFNIPIVVDLIFFFIFLKIGLYYLLPTFMRVVSDYQFEREDGVAIFDLVKLYFIELISWSVWMMVVLVVFVVFSKKRKTIQRDEFLKFRHSESKKILIVLTLGFIVTMISALTNHEGSLFLEVFKSLFFYGGLASSPLLMVISLKYFGKAIFLLGATASLISIITLSTRGAIVYMAMFCLFLVWFVLRDRISKIISIILISSLSLSYFVFGGLISGSIFIDESGGVSVEAGVDSDKKGTRSTLEEIEWRFGASTRMGTAFINIYERGESAGINPIKHSLMGFLPRSLNPDKPIPSTLYGDDIYSQGMYIISREINGYDTFNMVEFPTGAHFYWEFGIIGVLVLSAISGLYIALCAHFFSKLGLVALPLMVAVFKPWGYVDPKIWVSDIVMQIYQIIFPIIFLVCIIRFFQYGFKVIKKLRTHTE